MLVFYLRAVAGPNRATEAESPTEDRRGTWPGPVISPATDVREVAGEQGVRPTHSLPPQRGFISPFQAHRPPSGIRRRASEAGRSSSRARVGLSNEPLRRGK